MPVVTKCGDLMRFAEHLAAGERAAGKWNMKVSSYRKPRLAPKEVCGQFQAAGLRCEVRPGARGMVRLTADA